VRELNTPLSCGSNINCDLFFTTLLRHVGIVFRVFANSFEIASRRGGRRAHGFFIARTFHCGFKRKKGWGGGGREPGIVPSDMALLNFSSSGKTVSHKCDGLMQLAPAFNEGTKCHGFFCEMAGYCILFLKFTSEMSKIKTCVRYIELFHK